MSFSMCPSCSRFSFFSFNSLFEIRELDILPNITSFSPNDTVKFYLILAHFSSEKYNVFFKLQGFNFLVHRILDL